MVSFLKSVNQEQKYKQAIHCKGFDVILKVLCKIKGLSNLLRQSQLKSISITWP